MTRPHPLVPTPSKSVRHSGFRLLAMGALLAASAVALAQERRPVDPVLTGETAAATDVPPLLIETMRSDRSQRLTLPVTLDGEGPYGFIVDTGAERTVISRELALRLGLMGAGQARVIGIAEAVTADLYHLNGMQLRHVALGNLVVPAFAETSIGGPGLIGIDSLENHRLLMDFTNGQIDLRPTVRGTGRRRDTEFDRDSIIVTARRRAGRMILSNATYNGRRVDLVIDTGGQASVGNMALRRLVARDSGRRRAALVDGQLTSVTGATLAVQMGVLDAVSIGGFDMNNLPVAFAESPVFAELGLDERPALLLGMSALRLFDRIAVDFGNRRVTFDLPGGPAGRGQPADPSIPAQIPR